MLGQTVLLLASLTASSEAASAETLFKAVSYDRNIEARTPEGLRLGALYSAETESSKADAEKLAAEARFLQPEIAPAWVEIVPFAGEIELYRWTREHHISVLYVATGLEKELPAIIRASEAAGVVTLAGAPDYVEQGLVIGVRVRGGSNKLLVNMGAAERCGVDFHGAVRQVAERVGDAPSKTGRAEVNEALTRYAEALEQRDLGALHTVWPELEGEEERRVMASFEMTRSHTVAFAILDVDTTGGSVRARVRRTDKLVTSDGKTIVAGTLVEIFFSKASNGWVIASMGKAAPLS